MNEVNMKDFEKVNHEAGSNEPPPKMLKRYTTLEYLQNILINRKLSFSNPIYWEDKNDTELIDEYRKRVNASKIFVICFSCEHENIHFWKTYANGNSSCCIIFEANYLLSLFNKKKLMHGYIQYEEISKLSEADITIEKIPFMKRFPYRIEEEYRVIYKDFNNLDCFTLDIDPRECLNKIIVSPDVPAIKLKAIKQQWAKLMNGTKKSPHATTVYRNNEWIRYFKNLQK